MFECFWKTWNYSIDLLFILYFDSFFSALFSTLIFNCCRLTSVSLDISNEYNTGSSERALAVEQCSCPPGYKGLSCEDCAAGYTRADEGIYLGLCEPCNCNGNSNECDPETGVCFVSNCI